MIKRFLAALLALVVIGSISIIGAVEWRWNGYFGVNYEDSTKAGKYGSYDAYVLSLIPNISVDDALSIAAQIDYEHAPFIDTSGNDDGTKSLDSRTSGEISLSNVYASYVFSDYLKINAGKFFAPVGLYNQILYAVPSYPTLSIPRASVYNRSDSFQKDALFFQRYVTGLWLAGNASLAAANVSYDLYTGNGRSFEFHVDDNDSKLLGARIKLEKNIGGASIRPIISYYNDEYNNGTPDAVSFKKQTSLIPGLEVETGDLTLRGEYATSSIKNDDGSKYKDFAAYYAGGYYTLMDSITPYVRYELLDPSFDAGNDLENETTIGIAYHLTPWVSLLKLQVRLHNYEDSSKTGYTIFGAGLAVGF